ncbi:hypothetical protein GGF32_008418 [Allomyces javanicus]|nr:hypothetical protein GGF32_008418 [Allomyces javanicus]
MSDLAIILPIVLGTLGALLILTALVWFVRRRRQKQASSKNAAATTTSSGAVPPAAHHPLATANQLTRTMVSDAAVAVAPSTSPTTSPATIRRTHSNSGSVSPHGARTQRSASDVSSKASSKRMAAPVISALFPDTPETIESLSRRSESSLARSARSDLSSILEDPIPMVVVARFIQSNEDELAIKPGDKVLVYKSYSDGWCLAVDENGNDGFVPAACVVETGVLKTMLTSATNQYHGPAAIVIPAVPSTLATMLPAAAAARPPSGITSSGITSSSATLTTIAPPAAPAAPLVPAPAPAELPTLPQLAPSPAAAAADLIMATPTPSTTAAVPNGAPASRTTSSSSTNRSQPSVLTLPLATAPLTIPTLGPPPPAVSTLARTDPSLAPPIPPPPPLGTLTLTMADNEEIATPRYLPGTVPKTAGRPTMYLTEEEVMDALSAIEHIEEMQRQVVLERKISRASRKAKGE